jgi:hypothetical protein
VTTKEQAEFFEALSAAYPDLDEYDGSSIGILVNAWRAMAE